MEVFRALPQNNDSNQKATTTMHGWTLINCQEWMWQSRRFTYITDDSSLPLLRSVEEEVNKHNYSGYVPLSLVATSYYVL